MNADCPVGQYFSGDTLTCESTDSVNCAGRTRDGNRWNLLFSRKCRIFSKTFPISVIFRIFMKCPTICSLKRQVVLITFFVTPVSIISRNNMSSFWKIGQITDALVKAFLIAQHQFMASNWMNLIEISFNGKSAFNVQWAVLPVPFGKILQVGF